MCIGVIFFKCSAWTCCSSFDPCVYVFVIYGRFSPVILCRPISIFYSGASVTHVTSVYTATHVPVSGVTSVLHCGEFLLLRFHFTNRWQSNMQLRNTVYFPFQILYFLNAGSAISIFFCSFHLFFYSVHVFL